MTAASFAPRALRDIDEAVEAIAASAAGPVFAERFAVAVADGAEKMTRRPLLGHRRLDLLPGRFRFWPIRGFDYLLVYDADHPDRLILRVVYMGRDLSPLLLDLRDEGGQGGLP